MKNQSVYFVLFKNRISINTKSDKLYASFLKNTIYKYLMFSLNKYGNHYKISTI